MTVDNFWDKMREWEKEGFQNAYRLELMLEVMSRILFCMF